MAMGNSDRCPHCGTPYMSSVAPGAVDDRLCYTCNKKSNAHLTAVTSGGDELELVPNEESAPHFQAPRGMAHKKLSGTRAAVTSKPNLPAVRASGTHAAVPAVKTGGSSARMAPARGASNAAIPAARISNASMPAARGSSNASVPAAKKPAGHSTQAMPAIRASSTRVGSARSGGMTVEEMRALEAAAQQEAEVEEVDLQTAEPTDDLAIQVPANAAPDDLQLTQNVAASPAPYMRSSARHRAVSAPRKSSPVGAIVAALVILGGAYGAYTMLDSKPQAEGISTEKSEVVDKKVETSTAAPKQVEKKTVESAPKPEKKKPVDLNTALAKREAERARDSAANTSTSAREPVVSSGPAVPARPSATEPVGEPTVVAATPAEPAAPTPTNEELLNKPAAKGRFDDEEAEIAAMDKKIAKENSTKTSEVKTDNKAGALEGMGINGVSKKKKPEEDVPEFDDIRKPKAVVPITATEPTIMAKDMTFDTTPEGTFSQNLQNNLPGWRVRDINVDHSVFTSSEHRGKRDVLILNPLNDQLPSKLMCTVEIPKEFSGRRPMLAFEISTKDKNADWFVAVKCNGTDLRPKSVVKVPDEAKWMPVVVDLSVLAGKRFDLAIEAYMTPKTHNKKWLEEKAYIRNVQLTWPGKK